MSITRTEKLYLNESFETWRQKINTYSDKLNDIEDGANQYVLPIASENNIGGIKIDPAFFNISANGTLSISGNSGMKYWKFKTSLDIEEYVVGGTYGQYSCVLKKFYYISAINSNTGNQLSDTTKWTLLPNKANGEDAVTVYNSSRTYQANEYVFYSDVVNGRNFLLLSSVSDTTSANAPVIIYTNQVPSVQNNTYWVLVSEVNGSIKKYDQTQTYSTNQCVYTESIYLSLVNSNTSVYSNQTNWVKINSYIANETYPQNSYVVYKEDGLGYVSLWKNDTTGGLATNPVSSNSGWTKINVSDTGNYGTISKTYNINGVVDTSDTSMYMCFYGSTLISKSDYKLTRGVTTTTFEFTNLNPTELGTYVTLYYFQSGTTTSLSTPATTTTLGGVKPDGTTITVDDYGVISLNTETYKVNGKKQWSTTSISGTTEYTFAAPTYDKFPSNVSSDYQVYYDGVRLASSKYTINPSLNKLTLSVAPTVSKDIIIEYFNTTIPYQIQNPVTSFGNGLKVENGTLYIDSNDHNAKCLWTLGKTGGSFNKTTSGTMTYNLYGPKLPTTNGITNNTTNGLYTNFVTTEKEVEYNVYLNGLKLFPTDYTITPVTNEDHSATITLHNNVTISGNENLCVEFYSAKTLNNISTVTADSFQNGFVLPVSKGGTGATTINEFLSGNNLCSAEHATLVGTETVLGHVYLDDTVSNNTSSGHTVKTSALYNKFSQVEDSIEELADILLLGINNSTPVGTVKMYTGSRLQKVGDSYITNNPPTNWLWCDGSSVSSVAYPELYSVIGTKYGAETINNVIFFKVPNLINKVFQGGFTEETATSPNMYRDAALPNITGEHGLAFSEGTRSNGASNCSGAFSFTSAGSKTERVNENDTEASNTLMFNARNCSTVYNNDCNTVQPPACLGNFIIKCRSETYSSLVEQYED